MATRMSPMRIIRTDIEDPYPRHGVILVMAQRQAPGQLEYAARKLGRVVDCTGLENRQTERFLGFESLSFRQNLTLSN